jgi:hypothetical protein
MTTFVAQAPSSVGGPMLTPTEDEEQIVQRIATLGISKAEVVCCVRVPDQAWTRPGGPTAAGGHHLLDDDPLAAAATVDGTGRSPGR